MLKNHDIVTIDNFEGIIYEKKPCLDQRGNPVEGLYNAWIWINNPTQFNSYTTGIVKEIILAFRQASNDRSVVAVVFTSVGDRAFCSGGNTKEYAEYYAGNPQEYKQYMRLFNDMVTTILHCDKPVINRVNGLRIGGGQEIGMACDFSIASDLARFGQAGPKHGSAPIGGSTDFLHLFAGIGNAIEGCSLCEHWSAHHVYRLGVINDIVPVLKVGGKFIPNPMVVTERWLDESGRLIYGAFKTGEEMEKGKALFKQGEVDLSPLDAAVNSYATKLLLTFPDCTINTIENLRKKKLEHWDRNRESSRAWLGLNMMTEARAGFQAFNDGPKHDREVDFIKLRQMLAEGHPWDEEMTRAISPQYK